MPSKLVVVAFLLAGAALAAPAGTTLKDLSGADVPLSSIGGNAILLDFWATWCDSCAESIPFYEGLQKKYGSSGLAIVGISEDDRAKDVAAFAAKTHVTYRLLLDKRRRAYDAYEVLGLPTAILLDSSGTVRGRWQGFDAKSKAEIEKQVRSLVAERKPR